MAPKQGGSIPLQEDIDPDYEPSAEEIADYAQWLGLNVEAEKELAWICREGLKAKLPADWKAFRTADDGEVYYYNATSGDSSWEHPCDERFMKLYADEKGKLLARRRTQEQASRLAAQDVKPKPGVLPPLKTAPVGGKAALPPLSKAPAQPVQPVSSTSPLQPGGPSSSAPAESTAGQAGVKLLKQPREAYAAVTAQTSLLQGPPLGPVTESMRSDKQPKRVTADQNVEADMRKAKLESEGRLAALRKELLAAEDRERAELEQEYRDRLEALRAGLSQREAQAKQQSADRLQSLSAEADRLEASARQEGEARCAAVQAHNMVMLTAFQEQQQDSGLRLAELKQQHQQLHLQLQQQISDLTEQQQEQQQVRQEALASLKASIEGEVQPLRQQLREEALAALQSHVAHLVQEQRQQLENTAVSRMRQDISQEVEARRKQLQDAALVAMRSEVNAEVTKLRSRELEQAQQELRQQLQQQVDEERDQQLNQLRADMSARLLLNRQRLEEEHANLLEAQAQESRLKAQDAVREDEGKWVEQERKLMERRVRHQVQAEEAALLAVDMAAAERRIRALLDTHISELRQQVESEQRAELSKQIQLQIAEEKAAKLAIACMEQEAADAVAQQSPQAQAQVHSADQLGISKSQNAACEKLQASSEPQHANAELGQTSGESQAAESQSELLSSIRDFVTMARDGIKQRQVALQYTRTTWQACLNERPVEALEEVLRGLRGVMEAEALQLNTETQALHALKAHVKAVEKGCPIAAPKVAASKQASPVLIAANPNTTGFFFSGPVGGFTDSQYPVHGGTMPMGCPSWGAYNSAGKDAPEQFQGCSPSGSRGLDSIRQALSAALQACDSRRQGTGLGPIAAAWPCYSTPNRYSHAPSPVLPNFRASSAGHAQHSRPHTAQEVFQNHSRWLRSFNAQMYM